MSDWRKAATALACCIMAWPSGRSAGAADPSPAVYEMGLQEAWIPLSDGVRLAADLFLPRGGRPGERFPVLLEYLPYRKTEDRGRNHSLYSYFVRRGYAVARVDIRGTGSSEGTLVEYEYSDREQRDAEAVIDWLSKQTFSTGDVGMFGISWGGFNSIHLAMRRARTLVWQGVLEFQSDRDNFHYTYTRRLLEGDRVIREKTWKETIARDFQ